MTFRITDIQVLDYGLKSQACFDFFVDGSLHHLFKIDSSLVLMFYLYFNGRFEAFLEIADHNKLIKSFNRIKVC